MSVQPINQQNINQVLPQEVISEILGHLDIQTFCKAERVCLLWKRLINSKNSYDFSQKNITNTDLENLENFVAKHPNLQNLNLTGFHMIEGNKLMNLIAKCQNLRILNLTDCNQITTTNLAQA